VYEPFLIQNGFLMRSPRGRIATNNAYRRFGYAIPATRNGAGNSQVNLFEA
jgi:Holliday junction DNA helicase RuvB